MTAYLTFPINSSATNMSTGVVHMDYGRSLVWPTQVQTAASGKEMRAQFQSQQLREYVLKVTSRRQAGGAGPMQDEVQNLNNFFNMVQGPLLPFWFVDLHDMTTNLCRFKDEALVWTRHEASVDWWETTISLKQVLA